MTESSAELGARRAARRIAVRISLACGLAMIAVFAVGGLYLWYRTSRPARSNAESAGSFMIRLDPPDLIAGMIILGIAGVLLAAAVGWLSARSAIQPLEDSLARQRQFVQDASHELRTPLAILDARVQLVQRLVESPSEAGKALTKVRHDTASLTAVVEDLLLAVTAVELTKTSEVLEITALVKEVAGSGSVLAEEQGIVLELQTSQPVYVRIAESSLRRAVLALVENAVAHTPVGGRILIAVAAVADHAQLSVSDTGAGLSTMDRERVFERFVRGSDAGSARRGFGIGLAIVWEIATAAGGSAEVVESGPSGTTMRISLPLSVPPGP
ncbi:sensor histidine kinase [Psychromicrobium lacuslunae]|uniref:Sensor-like histidine kinase SenX3 n=1 Tax=Psychromicrobium lacuslunae TaxID=1618207 RepID=A0A0D4BZW6_9MICC|nr:HAMP domain-containing sensor histidine kinase [Psychromicrobium lacuslunae]AJT41859.1 hypothetical protein UM93_10645 [Psychromicrobium lacuslunae]